MMLEFTYLGNLKLNKVSINANYIVSIQDPCNSKYGCIITTIDGDKFPVQEKYLDVIRLLKNNK